MPSIVKRGDSYRIFVSAGVDANGKTIRRTTTYHPPKGTCEKRARFLAESYAYSFEERCRMFRDMNDSCCFSELSAWYFDSVAPMKLKTRTIENNRRLVESYVIPYFGNLRLRDITTYKVDMMISGLLKNGSKSKGPLKAGTVNLIRAATSSIFSTALKKGIVSKNPVSDSTPPCFHDEERQFLDVDACKMLLSEINEIPNEQVSRAIKILLYTGLRRGELLGLHWQDVNFEKKEIYIKYTVYKKGVTSPKTRTSVRTVSLADEAENCFMEQYGYIEKLRTKAGQSWKETNAVFVNKQGDYMNGEYLNNTFRNFLKKKGLPGMHIHDLRHANASILINSGVPMKVVSEHLGHSSVKTTEDFYTHLFESSKKITAEVVSKALSGEM